MADVGEVTALEIYARKMTKALTGLTANGSEFFVRIGENYYADVDRCVTYIRDRHERAHDMLVQEVTARKAAESERDELREALRPFAEFGENTGDDGWLSNIHNEGISTWFGPSDFRRAARLLAGKGVKG